MQTDSTNEEPVLVICPTCRTRMSAPREWIGKRIRCPDCHVHVLVKKPVEEVQVRTQMKDVGEYSVLGSEQAPPGPECFLVICPTCHAHLQPSVNQVGETLVCPDCDRTLVVPPAPLPPPAPKLERVRDYGVATAAERPPAPMEIITQRGMVEPIPPAPKAPPSLWFWTGVHDFVWRKEVLPRFGILSAQTMIAAELLAISLVATGILRGNGSAMALFSTLAFGIFSSFGWLLALAYGSACFLGVLLDTANGNDDVQQWPEGAIIDWIGSLVRVAYSLVMTTGLSAAVAKLISIFVPSQVITGIVLIATCPAMFPLFLLSSLEADSMLMPWAPRLWREIQKSWTDWLLVYAFSVALAAVLGGVVVAGCLSIPLLISFPAGVLLAFATLLYARLLGRLMWKTSAKKRKKKSASTAAATAASS